MQTPEWLTGLETLTFLGMLAMGIYNRVLNWRKFQDRTTALENSFKQYQSDQKLFFETMKDAFSSYLKTCETCRAEVRNHHEQDTRHVTVDLRQQIANMAEEISEIKRYLMERK